MVKTDVFGEIEGDESTAYSSWKAFEEAVESGKEEIKEVNPKKRLEYEFNVDKALDSIDLTFNGYVPSKDAIEFFNVIRLVLGEEPEVKNSLAHYFLVDLVFNNVKREQYPYSREIRDKIRLNERKIAIIAARGSAKSTVISAYLPIYVAVTGKIPNFGKVLFMVGFGDSQQAGAKVQANTIRDFCDDSTFCKDYFEKTRFTDEECEFIRKGPGKIKTRAFMYKVKGAAGGSVRGIRYRTERPACFIFDDIIKSEAEANSPIIMKKLTSMIYSDAENALSASKGKIIIVNTPFNKKDPVYSALENGVWTPVCLPMCQEMTMETTKKDFVGVWESMHPYDRIKERYEDAFYGDTLREFNQELMLRISSTDDKMIKDGMIKKFDREVMRKVLGNYTLICTTDFTASSSKKGDYAGIAMWAIGAGDNKFLLDLYLKKCTIQDQYDALFSMVNRWSTDGRVIEVGIETDGQQQTHLFALEQMMLEKNFWFRFAKQKGASSAQVGIRSRAAGGNKLERFKYMMPSFEGGRIWFAEQLDGTEDMNEMQDEIEYLTNTSINSKHDDGLDLISQLGLIDYVIPTNTTGTPNVTKHTNSMWGEAWFTEEEEDKNSMVF